MLSHTCIHQLIHQRVVTLSWLCRVIFSTKLDIIHQVEKGEKKSKIAAAYSTRRSTLSTVLKNKQDIREKANQRPHLSTCLIWTPFYDEALYKWFTNMRAKAIPVSCLILQQKAKDFSSSSVWKTSLPAQDGCSISKSATTPWEGSSQENALPSTLRT